MLEICYFVVEPTSLGCSEAILVEIKIYQMTRENCRIAEWVENIAEFTEWHENIGGARGFTSYTQGNRDVATGGLGRAVAPHDFTEPPSRHLNFYALSALS